MLSTAHSNLHERHRQHRRQISTPSALDAVKAPSLPAQAMHRYHAHRRGQSFDNRALRVQRSQSMQDGTTHTTNTTVPQPHHPNMLGDSQHQRYLCVAQPSFPQQSAPMPVITDCFTPEEVQNLQSHNGQDSQPSMAYLNAPFGKDVPHMNMHFDLMQQQQMHSAKVPCGSGTEGQFFETGLWDFYQPTFPGQADVRKLSVQSEATPSQHPHTPKHGSTQYAPITPATTPFKQTVGLAQYGGDIQSGSTKDQGSAMPGSAQSSYMQRAKSLQGVAGTTFTQQKFDVSSPPNTASFEVDNFDTFNYEQGSSFEVPKSESLSQSQYASSSSASSSFMSSPELAAMPCPEDGAKTPKIPIYPATPNRPHHRKTPSATPSSAAKPKLSPRVASIDNLNLDARVQASIKETGVTIDEIASYIHGPDPEDGKWVCLHPGCERRFGRKENIKSHVQTHLGDRQYKCDHCNKCFVRGHDLKRHAKIHTGDKPYECLCGNVFARHDALTRHRQRGMCIGGYKGIVRKTTKRGRPKKHRPEMDERQDKASRTRQRIAEKSSFDSSTSESSRNTPPSEVFENMSLHGSSPAEEMPVFNNPNYSLPPEVFTFTPPASPGYSVGIKPSPSRDERSITPSSEDEMLPSSPSKQPLESLVTDSSLPYMSDPETCPYTDASGAASHSLSSPHAAPTLSESSNGSDLDIFISQDSTSSFGKPEFGDLADSDMAPFPDYVNTTSFEGGLELFPNKPFSSGPVMADDFFFQFQVDEQASDVMTKEFFMD
ncbi:putative C2H2 transcription factor (Swi5) [Aspergillus luchuensis]|uniref:C2H2 transcription factor Swi5 n=1 Tax=Aspergillus kawachii TaxID=1069201 RepID=A0A146FBH8_ASPKA|nr:metallothionein expression activator [Aspergillus luchuensis]BCR93530.1 metallothionein expression activator [Aspergillus luchuensis]BCS06166.1 metallothionein expression activator [Aspergillus luchuensis]GAA88847.1 C2H2 transcription factor Swi5 [Aspergillus luchuensis IFO 4308]GAT23440.1 C2H2 transcription factor Swi5 [Aspergillus luchuensis]